MTVDVVFSLKETRCLLGNASYLFDVNRMRLLLTPLSESHNGTASIVSSPRREHLEDVTHRLVFSVFLGVGVWHLYEGLVNVINVALGQGKARRGRARIMSPFQRPAFRDVGSLLMGGLGRERGFCSGEETRRLRTTKKRKDLKAERQQSISRPWRGIYGKQGQRQCSSALPLSEI